jgi:hydrogenase/urease accessory protein HupE
MRFAIPWQVGGLAIVTLAIVVVGEPRIAVAHGPAPIGVSIDEHRPGEITVRQRRAHGAVALPLPRFTAGCTAIGSAADEVERESLVTSQAMRCDVALAGTTIEQPGLVPGGPDAMLRVALHDGAVHRDVATAAAPRVEIPAASSGLAVFTRHVGLGASHLLGGADHLAFALALVLLARTWRAAIAGVSAFAVGHSLTLVAATLGWVRVPSTWAELGIAASVVLVALELARARPGPPPRRLVVAASVAGLVHGLGFATALAQSGGAALVPALAGFNLGVELGQLVGIAGLGVGAVVLRRVGVRDTARGRVWIGHGLGVLGMAWGFEVVMATIG